jgi:UDP-N-acetylglucosamine--N-acetylmuramyl-(pentapeptide) pyrophosphoryl-undecaprenol N-acetylglucosamine transferase
VAAGAAVLIEDASFTADRVRAAILPLLGDPVRLDAMRVAAASVGSRRGTEDLIALIDGALAP